MTKMTTEEAFVKVLQMHGIQHSFGGDIGTTLRVGPTQVAAGTNVGDAGARYVFNVDNATPSHGVGIIAENSSPFHLSILNKTFKADGDFNYGLTINQAAPTT